MDALNVRFRIDLSEGCAVGPGKVALLEAIDRSGSLSQAARDLGMSYRRAWLLLESLNLAFRKPVAILAVGGKGGGGARITPFGRRVIRAYREFESQLLRRARTRFRALAREAVVEPRSSLARRRPLNRSVPSSALPVSAARA
jgi:molybdate transport system regulatory protein